MHGFDAPIQLQAPVRLASTNQIYPRQGQSGLNGQAVVLSAGRITNLPSQRDPAPPANYRRFVIW